VCLLGALTILFGLAAGLTAQAQDRSGDLNPYVGNIGKARAELDAGCVAEARKLLQATDKNLRRFEFDYLLARAEKSEGEGKPAPDLIRRMPKPDVETRFGVLDELQRRVVFICRDGSLRVYDIARTAAEPKHVKHPQGAAVWSGMFSHDGKTFVSGHQNGEVLVWDATTWEVRHTVSLGNDWPVRELAVSPDGSAVVAESMKALELWSLAGAKPAKVADVGVRYNFGEGLAFSPKGDLIATGGMFDIVLHDAKTGEKTRSMRHASYTMGLEFSPEGSRIASAPRGNVNKFLAVFDVKQDAPLFNAGPFGNYVAGLGFSPDGSRIAATGCEKLFRIFDASTGRIVLSLDRPECGARPAFSRDGRLLGWNEPDGFLFIDLGQAVEVPGAANSK
jgi:WD40 repeat protein